MRVESADNVAETQRNISSTLRNLSGLQVSLLVRVGASIIPQTVVSIAAIKASSISCRCNELPVTGEANFSSVTLPSPHLVSVWITIALLLRVVELLQHWGPGCYGAVARSGLWRRCGLARAEYHAISRDARGPDSAAESNGSEARAPSAVDSAESRHRDDPRSPSQRLVSSVQGVWLIVGFLACLALRNDVVEVSPWATSNQVVKNVTAAGFGGGSDPVRLFCGDGAAGCTGSGSAEIVTTRLTSTMLTLFEVLLAMDTIQFGLLPFCLMGVCLVPLMCCCIPMTLISILLCVGLLRSRRRDVPSSASIPNVKTLPFQPGLCPDEDHSVCSICLVDFEDRVTVSQLPCNGRHVFHQECIDKWFAINTTCPTCRQELLPDTSVVDLEAADRLVDNAETPPTAQP